MNKIIRVEIIKIGNVPKEMLKLMRGSCLVPVILAASGSNYKLPEAE